LYLGLLLLLIAGATSVSAEPVSVNRGIGLGYIFNHRGNCYLILPAHVHGRQRRLSFATAAPITTGDAEVFQSFGTDTDLSIALVTSDIGDRCRDRWGDLPANLQPQIDRTNIATLVRVDASGVERRDEMRITATSLDTITAVTAGAGRNEEIYQGTSGGLLRAGDAILGMAIQSTDPSSARFLRMDEIVARLSRLLDARTAAPSAPAPATADASAPPGCKAGAIALRAAQCSVEPASPEQGCTNLVTGAGPLVLPPGSRTPVIALELRVDRPVPVKSVDLASLIAGGAYSAPRSVIAEVSSSEGAPRWRRFASGDMTPLGALRLAEGAGSYANRIRLSLTSDWHPDLPLRLDCVAVN
jgi:hypothetical protein